MGCCALFVCHSYRCQTRHTPKKKSYATYAFFDTRPTAKKKASPKSLVCKKKKRVAAGEIDAPAELGGFLVDDAFSPLPTNCAARTPKEVLDKLADGDFVPFDLLSQFKAKAQSGAAGREEAQLRHLSDEHRRTCETLQATEDALLSECQDFVHQKNLHTSTTECLQSPIGDLQVKVTKLVQTLDRKRAAAEGPGTVDTRIQQAAKTLLSLARKLPP